GGGGQKYAYVKNNSKTIPLVILIIGESTQRNYLNLYGYPLPTTPKLKALRDSQNLFIFNDVISPAVHTDESLRQVLTFGNYENEQTPWHQQMNIVDTMKIAGYKTFWLSNQEPVSIYGNSPQAIAKRADHLAYTTLADSYAAGVLKDEKILELLESRDIVKAMGKNNFFVFHLMGTHFDYNGRYTSKFAQFSAESLKQSQLNYLAPFWEQTPTNTQNPTNALIPANVNPTPLTNSQSTIKSQYLNAVLYNDFVVSEIIKRFADKETIIFYLSDHGEEIYDFRNSVGHSFNMVSRYMVEVPFMIYVSDSLKKSYPQLVGRITQAQNLPFMSDDFLHAFFDLLEIQVADLQPQRSLFNKKFDKSRARIVHGRDYERDLKSSFEAPDKIWLHHVDDLEKLNKFLHKYRNFEIDAHFLENDSGVGYFDVGHDGKEYSINLNLAQMLQTIIARDKHDMQNKENLIFAKVWLDFKNLSDSNETEALKELQRLCDELRFPYSNIIVESGNFKNLASFRKAGFKTSYYVPYYDKQSLDSKKEEIEAQLQNIIKSQSVDYLSFPYYLYEFIKSLDLKVCKGRICEDMPLLTWNEYASYKVNMLEKAYLDPQVRAILAGEEGGYR
uniref:phosphoethanolamine transferase n=1 Tax=Helicobacter sp. 'CLO3_human' TaxID=2020249 RepID=UPI000CF05F6F